MNLLQRRRNIVRALERELTSNFQIVREPDHPLLIRGPDILIGSDRGLLCVFLPSSDERTSNSSLQTRLILSRLAMPPATCNVLVLEAELDQSLGDKLGHDFSEVLSLDESKELVALSKEAAVIGERTFLPHEIIVGARAKFADLFQVTRAMRLVEQRRRKDNNLLAQRVNPSKPARRSDTRYLAEDVVVAEFGEGRISTNSVAPLARQQIEAGYVLDRGVPYPTGDAPYGLALVEQLPTYRSDPDKILRAAAFAGWAFVESDEELDLLKLGGNLSNRRRNQRFK